MQATNVLGNRNLISIKNFSENNEKTQGTSEIAGDNGKPNNRRRAWCDKDGQKKLPAIVHPNPFNLLLLWLANHQVVDVVIVWCHVEN